MSAIMGRIRNGQVLLDSAAPWPEGSSVSVELSAVRNSMTEEQQLHLSTDELDAWLHGMEPLAVSPDEEETAMAWMKKSGQMTQEQEKALFELFP